MAVIGHIGVNSLYINSGTVQTHFLMVICGLIIKHNRQFFNTEFVSGTDWFTHAVLHTITLAPLSRCSPTHSPYTSTQCVLHC